MADAYRKAVIHQRNLQRKASNNISVLRYAEPPLQFSVGTFSYLSGFLKYSLHVLKELLKDFV